MSAARELVPVAPRVESFLGDRHELLIGGRWQPAAGGESFALENPAHPGVLAEVAYGRDEDIDRAVAAARDAFENGPWRRITPSERGRLLWKLADLIELHGEEFAQLETLDNGKPLAVASYATPRFFWAAAKPCLVAFRNHFTASA